MEYIFLVMCSLIVLYVICIAPKLLNRQDHAPFLGVYYAHRGLHDNYTEAPENSLKSFELAVAAGYGMELDVQLTKDDVLVVFHDDTLKRVCGVEGKVCDFTYEQLQAFTLYHSQEKIPTLGDVLRVVDGKVPLIIEIKMPAANARVCEVTNEVLKHYNGVYCIESFHPYALQWYRKHRPDVVRGQLSSNFKKDFGKHIPSRFIMQHLLTNVLTKPDFIAYCHLYPNGLSRKLCKSLFRTLGVAWTVKSQAELDACKDEFDIFIFEGFVPDVK
ncbi:MAG TPA: glycerophosphodiester phosphodiesterase [Firmicutes bacterium]|nr:glycerophosphodiester phosphodiesterase [Bacillota bacterium]